MTTANSPKVRTFVTADRVTEVQRLFQRASRPADCASFDRPRQRYRSIPARAPVPARIGHALRSPGSSDLQSVEMLVYRAAGMLDARQLVGHSFGTQKRKGRRGYAEQ